MELKQNHALFLPYSSLINGLLLFDLKKAFDLVNHNTLIQKLKLYGFSPSALQWFTSYLADRKQCVNFLGTLSERSPVTSGVPQRSILGPLLFLLLINDLPHYLPEHDSTVFADDTTILASGTNTLEVNEQLNAAANHISNWANANLMAVKTTKTKTMLIATRQKR